MSTNQTHEGEDPRDYHRRRKPARQLEMAFTTLELESMTCTSQLDQRTCFHFVRTLVCICFAPSCWCSLGVVLSHHHWLAKCWHFLAFARLMVRTGPATQFNFMGYAKASQTARGIHMQLRSRAYIIAEPLPESTIQLWPHVVWTSFVWRKDLISNRGRTL